MSAVYVEKNCVKIAIDKCMKISGLSDELLTVIKRDLTIPNPKYDSVKKYSRYAYTKVSPYLMYFKVLDYETIEVPVGYLCSEFSVREKLQAIVEDYRVANKILFPRFVLELRETQKKAVENFFSYNKNELQMYGVCQLATGKGKSILALKIAKDLGAKTLIVVHKDDLVKGWKEDIQKAFNNKADVGLIKAKSRTVGKHFTIATVQTLSRMDESEIEKLYDKFTLVVQDECHHCPATTFAIVANFRARYRLGLTATPERTDGLSKVIEFYFGKPFYVYKSTQEDEDILPVVVKHRVVDFEYTPRYRVISGRKVILPYDPRKKTTGSLITELPYGERPKVPPFYMDTVSVSNAVEQVCKDIVSEYQRGHSCVVFFSQKESCRKYKEYLSQFISDKDILLYYGDNNDNDLTLKTASGRRKCVTLTTYAKATEGTNVVQWEVAFFVSSMNNGKNTEQAVGRIRRRGKVEKLDKAVVYDYDYTNVYGLKRHYYTRKERYEHLGFEVEDSNGKRLVFKRGFLQ